jgi:flagellar biosynthesis/type III secretory pathway protein FliH
MSTQRDSVLPVHPTFFPELASMSLEELHVHQEDQGTFALFVRQHPHTRAVNSLLQNLRHEVAALEKRNNEALLAAEMANVGGSGKDSEFGRSIDNEREELAASKAKLDAWLQRNSREALAARLRDGKKEALTESEALRKRFIHGDLPWAQFHGEYL